MTSLCPIPPRASVRDLLADLLGHEVTVADADGHVLDEARPSYAAVYRRDAGDVAAVSVFDLSLATAAGAAIGMVSAASAAAQVDEARRLDGDLLEFFGEVGNVLAKLLNSPTTPHVVMREIHPLPGEVPRDVAGVVLEPLARVDYQVAVRGFSPGTLTLVAG